MLINNQVNKKTSDFKGKGTLQRETGCKILLIKTCTVFFTVSTCTEIISFSLNGLFA
jgi:hypothetical protein